MNILILGKETKFIYELTTMINQKMNCMLMQLHFDTGKIFDEVYIDETDILIVDINTRNASSCFDIADKVVKINSSVIIIFVCNYLLLEWKRKALDREIFLIDKNKSTLEIVEVISKIVTRCESVAVDFKPKRILTKTEEKIMHLSYKGFKQREIAEELDISVRTAQSHFSNIASKLGTKSQTESVVRALELGIIAIDYEFAEEFCVSDFE